MAMKARKLALVIGIGKYDSLESLSNPENNASDMSSTLKSINFTVTTALHPKRIELQHILAEFENSIQPGDLVLFYFSGHGIQWKDQNYLLPKDTPKLNEINLNGSTINAQDVLNTLTDRNPYETIFLLDCCRNPNDSSSIGFAPMQHAGAFVAFVCAPGATAIEGVQQRNSLFTKHLLKHITTPNEDIALILRTVRNDVCNIANCKQIPFVCDGLFQKSIYINPQPIVNSEKDYGFKQLFYKDLQIQEEIGRGAFGIVYKAKWLTTRLTVAVKILQLTNRSEKIKNRFLKKVSLLQRVRCQQIVSFYGACIEEEKYALVMEYMSLGSLYKILHEDNISLTWDERLSIALQAAIGINYLHQLPEPILHRDIKSNNFLLERAYNGYTLKLCDITLAGTRYEIENTIPNLQLSISIPWRAPEILHLKPYTDKSDIYSLGVVYWELAACKIPYDGHDDIIIRAFVLEGDRLAIPRDTPTNFRLIIEQCWAQKPTDRPNSSTLLQRIEDGITKQAFTKDCATWDVECVGRWVQSLEHINKDYSANFRSHGVDGHILITEIDDEVLKDLGVSTVLHRRLILKSIYDLKIKSKSSTDLLPIKNELHKIYYAEFQGDFIPLLPVDEVQDTDTYPNVSVCKLNHEKHRAIITRVHNWLGILPNTCKVEKIEFVFNSARYRMFLGQLEVVESRLNKPEFQPKLNDESERPQREQVLERLNTLCQQVTHNRRAQIVRMWHGCKRNAVPHLLSDGFAALGRLDDGWYGKAMYFTSSAKYAVRYCGAENRCLIMCYVLLLNPFPVIASDAPRNVSHTKFRFFGKGNYKNYQCHYIPVVPIGGPDTMDYRPPDSGPDDALYDELAVFQESNILPQIVVHLK